METRTQIVRCLCMCLLLSAVESETIDISERSLSETLSHIVSISKMTSIVVYSESEETVGSDIDYILDEHLVSQKRAVDITSMKTVMELEMKRVAEYSTVAEMMSNLNFIVLCNSTCVKHLLETKYDLMYEDIVLKHYSRWIIVLPNGDETTTLKNLLFDNSLVLSVTQKMSVVVETLVMTPRKKCLQRLSYLGAKDLFPNTEYGLKETQLTVAAMGWTPYTIERSLDNGTLDFVGISRDILDGLATTFNFTFKFVMPEDMAWGSEDKKGNWTGIIGMVQRNEVDLCITPYAWNPERRRVMVYGHWVSHNAWVIIYKKTTIQMKAWIFITTSFHLEVYLCWIVVLVATTTLFVLFELVNSNGQQRERKTWLRVCDSAMFALRVPLQQASPEIPASRSSRVLLCFWWLFTIVMTSVFTGNLMASLAVSLDDVPFNSMEELAANNEYTVGVFRQTQMEYFLKTSKKQTFQDIWKKIKTFRETQSPSAARDDLKYHTQLLSSGGYAFITGIKVAEEIMSVECDLKMMKGIFSARNTNFVYPLSFPLERIFSDRIRIMVESGLIDLWNKKWTPTQKTCSLTNNLKSQFIDVNVMFGAIIVALAGVGTGLGVLLVELLYTHYLK